MCGCPWTDAPKKNYWIQQYWTECGETVYGTARVVTPRTYYTRGQRRGSGTWLDKGLRRIYSRGWELGSVAWDCSWTDIGALSESEASWLAWRLSLTLTHGYFCLKSKRG